MPGLSSPLTFWLLVEPTDHVAVRTILEAPILLEEVRRVLPDLEREARRPATAQEIETIVGTRFAIFPQPQRSAGEFAAFWADYGLALEGLPAAAIEAGMASWVKNPDAEFLPRPGKLAELARKAPNRGKWNVAMLRARDALRQAEATSEPARAIKHDDPSRPSHEEVQAMLAETFAAMRAKAPDKPCRRPLENRPVQKIPTPTENDMSPAMKALLERQNRPAA